MPTQFARQIVESGTQQVQARETALSVHGNALALLQGRLTSIVVSLEGMKVRAFGSPATVEKRGEVSEPRHCEIDRLNTLTADIEAVMSHAEEIVKDLERLV